MIWIESELKTLLGRDSYKVDSKNYNIYVTDISGKYNLFNYSLDIFFEEDTLDFNLIENRIKEAIEIRLKELENLKNYLTSISSLSLERTKSKIKEEYRIKDFNENISLKYSREHKPKIRKNKKGIYIFEWAYCRKTIKINLSSNTINDIAFESLNVLIQGIDEIIEKLNIFLKTMY